METVALSTAHGRSTCARAPAAWMASPIVTGSPRSRLSAANTSLVGGYIKIEIQKADATWQDVTAEILNWGIAGAPEPTNAAYATAKLAGWQLCEAYRQQYGVRFFTAIPANAFGPHDDFSPEGGHVIPALIQRMHEAKVAGDTELSVWGTGMPRR